MSSPDEHDETRFEPDWGLGATLDPASFGAALLDLGERLARDPVKTSLAGARLVAGLASSAALTTARALGSHVVPVVAPDPGDTRFSDTAWEENPFYYGLRQSYLLWARYLRELVEIAGPDGRLAAKAEFAVEELVNALSPTNFLPGNPAALKKAFDTGGASVARGLAKIVDDFVTNNGRPRQVDRSAFTLGEDLAATPGQVVFRNELIELIQFEPRTETVYETPLLFSPPWINKYYVMDLAPGKSFAEWAVDHGHTTFCISYRNPDESMRELGFEDYLRLGPLSALETVEEITGAKQTNIAALCLGGTITAVLLGYLARTKTGRARIRSATLLNTLVDFSEPGPLGCFVDPTTVERLERRMEKRGYLDGSDMAGTFDVLRSNDLIWRYVVSGWLMGEDPPAFDILAWNADATRLPARMHSEYLRFAYLENRLANGSLEIGGKAIVLEGVPTDLYILSAVEDHITPWRGVYRATQLFGGAKRFVLSSAGHIAGIVNPPGGKRHHWTNEELPAAADAWLDGATQNPGTWWEDWAAWIADRGGERREPPPLGSTAHPPLEDAPGTYVRG